MNTSKDDEQRILFLGLYSVPPSGSLLLVEVSIDETVVNIHLHMFVKSCTTITPEELPVNVKQLQRATY